MAVVNQNIYPTEGESAGIIKWSKALTGANFADYLNGLENSITFSSTSNPNAPLKKYCTAFSTYNTDFDNYVKCARYTTAPNNQRIILTKSTNATDDTAYIPRSGSDSLGTKLLYDNPFSAGFANTHQIVTGINWQGLCGRLVVFFSLTPANDPVNAQGEHDCGYNSYVTTWKNFCNYAASAFSNDYTIIVWGVYIIDIWCGASSGSPQRGYAITPVNLNPAVATLFTTTDSGTEFSVLNYGAYRGSRSYPYPHSLTTTINGVAVSGAAPNNQTNWLPVFGGAFSSAGGYAGGQSAYNIANVGGYLQAGASDGEAPQHLFNATDSNDTVYHFAATAMIVNSGNFASFKQAMEERATSYGIIILTHALTKNAVRTKDLSNLTTATDVLIPLVNDTGLIGGYTDDGGEALTNAPTQAVIAGGVDGVFVHGAPVIDPENEDPNHYVDSIDLEEPNLTAIDAFNRTFAINKNGLDAFANFLWNANDTKFQEIVDGLKLFGENPIEGVINCILFPFDVAAKAGAAATSEIKIGRTLTGVDGYRLQQNANSVIELGTVKFTAAFEETAPFLDFEPYTSAELYIPFIGKIPVSTAQFVGHYITVKMIVDYITGACTAVVFCDEIPVIYKQGVIGIQIPITATNSAQFADSCISGTIGAAESLGNAAGAIAKKDIGGAVGGLLGTAFEMYQAYATPTMYESAGASSPQCAIYQPLKPYFVIYRPVPKEVNIYGHTVGFATQRSVIVGNCSGFSVFGNVDTTGIYNATERERAEIKTLLEGGVYV